MERDPKEKKKDMTVLFLPLLALISFLKKALGDVEITGYLLIPQPVS